MTDAQAYIHAHSERFLDELMTLLRFPSVSAQQHHDQDTCACARWLTEHLTDLGLQTDLIETTGHPIVRAQTPKRDGPQIIVYGHYDVQPEDPLDQWDSPPFAPAVRDGFIYARGATDDKGQLWAQIKGLETALQLNPHPPGQVVFLIEGEEESGGDALPSYVRDNPEHDQPAAVLVSDSSMYGADTPALCYGLRGTAAVEIRLHGPRRDIHSGSHGGAVANPALMLARMLSACVDEHGQITVPGFMDHVREPHPWEKENFDRLAFDENNYAQLLGVPQLAGEPDRSALERLWARPTLEINGIYGGYMGQGSKTIIPASAGAKITMRLVPDQHAPTVTRLLVDYLQTITPPGVRLEIVQAKPYGNPVLFDIDHPMMQTAHQALQIGFDKQPVYIREGGSIPVVECFQHTWACPVLLMGLGRHDDGAHGPNERFALDNFFNGIRTAAAFWQILWT